MDRNTEANTGESSIPGNEKAMDVQPSLRH